MLGLDDKEIEKLLEEVDEEHLFRLADNSMGGSIYQSIFSELLRKDK